MPSVTNSTSVGTTEQPPRAASSAAVMAPLPPKTVLVNTTDELMRAFKTMGAGGTILLASGDYGDVALSNLKATATVTIKSADANADANFHTLRLTKVANITIEDVDVNNVRKFGGVAPAMAVNGGTDVNLVGIDIAGSRNNNNADDGSGIIVGNSNRVTVLNSTFNQVRVAVQLSQTNDVIVAGNTISQTREGVNIGTVKGGLFENNLITDLRSIEGDHSDAFQIQNGGLGGGSAEDIVFRNNVMIQKDGPAFQGIFIRSERNLEGIHHKNITIENNYYSGSMRNGIAISNTDGVLIRENTVRYSGTGGLVPAIFTMDIQGGLVENNIATMLINVPNSDSSKLTWRNNIDVMDPKTGVGVAESALFAPTKAGVIDLAALGALPGSVAAVAGAGFKALAGIGTLPGAAAAQLGSYLPQFDKDFSRLAGMTFADSPTPPPAATTLPTPAAAVPKAPGLVITGGAGNDTIVSGRFGDTLDGGAGVDTISYAGSASQVVVNLGNNYTTGGDATKDKILNFENVIGSSYDDSLSGNALDNRIDGGDGDDTISASTGNDVVLGGDGNDSVRGGGGNDVISGGEGDDVLQGEGNNDIIDGGGGSNTLVGGSENDIFNFSILDGGKDIVTDFRRGFDKIDLSDIDAILGNGKVDAFKFIGGAAFSAAGQLRTYIDGGVLTLGGDVNGDGVADLVVALTGLTSLGATDIIFA